MSPSPARWPPDGRPETSRLLKVNHYMLHVRMKMRLGGCAAPPQDADTGEGYQELSPRSIDRGQAVLTQVCMWADLKAATYG